MIPAKIIITKSKFMFREAPLVKARSTSLEAVVRSMI